MKRFEFPLDSVRRWRREQASLEEQKLHKLYARLRAIEAERERLAAELAEAERATLTRASITSQDLAALDSYRFHIRDRRLQAARRQAQSQTEVDAQRAHVLEARRKAELLDRLKQKALAEWNAGMEKEQEELAAELFLARRPRGPHS